jgi:hypothetical protein
MSSGKVLLALVIGAFVILGVMAPGFTAAQTQGHRVLVDLKGLTANVDGVYKITINLSPIATGSNQFEQKVNKKKGESITLVEPTKFFIRDTSLDWTVTVLPPGTGDPAKAMVVSGSFSIPQTVSSLNETSRSPTYGGLVPYTFTQAQRPGENLTVSKGPLVSMKFDDVIVAGIVLCVKPSSQISDTTGYQMGLWLDANGDEYKDTVEQGSTPVQTTDSKVCSPWLQLVSFVKQPKFQWTLNDPKDQVVAKGEGAFNFDTKVANIQTCALGTDAIQVGFARVKGGFAVYFTDPFASQLDISKLDIKDDEVAENCQKTKDDIECGKLPPRNPPIIPPPDNPDWFAKTRQWVGDHKEYIPAAIAGLAVVVIFAVVVANSNRGPFRKPG